MVLYEAIPCCIKEISDHLKTQEMCNEAVSMCPYLLGHVLGHLNPIQDGGQKAPTPPTRFSSVTSAKVELTSKTF